MYKMTQKLNRQPNKKGITKDKVVKPIIQNVSNQHNARVWQKMSSTEEQKMGRSEKVQKTDDKGVNCFQ